MISDFYLLRNCCFLPGCVGECSVFGLHPLRLCRSAGKQEGSLHQVVSDEFPGSAGSPAVPALPGSALPRGGDGPRGVTWWGFAFCTGFTAGLGAPKMGRSPSECHFVLCPTRGGAQEPGWLCAATVFWPQFCLSPSAAGLQGKLKMLFFVALLPRTSSKAPHPL